MKNLVKLQAQDPQVIAALEDFGKGLYMEGASTGLSLGILEIFANTWAKYMQRSPHATFRKVKGISGKPESGGTYVADAMERLLYDNEHGFTRSSANTLLILKHF